MVKKESNIRPLTIKELGEFTEQVILPGVEAMISPLESKVDKLAAKIDKLTDTVVAGFADNKRSIQVLGGDVAELKETAKDHGERIKTLEQKVGVNR